MSEVQEVDQFTVDAQEVRVLLGAGPEVIREIAVIVGINAWKTAHEGQFIDPEDAAHIAINEFVALTEITQFDGLWPEHHRDPHEYLAPLQDMRSDHPELFKEATNG
jgi:hypothetical protein